MGSNSFRLEVGRVEGDQIYRLDTVRETLRIGAGIDDKGRLTRRCAARGARLPRALSRAAARPAPVGGARRRHAIRSASRRTRDEFLPQAERALGFPIDVISGHEEARLIYLGVAHVLPPSTRPGS